MVRAMDSGTRGPSLNPAWGHCVVFLGKTLLLSQCFSPPTGKFNAGRGNPAMDQHPNTPSTSYYIGISSSLIGRLVLMQITLFTVTFDESVLYSKQL